MKISKLFHWLYAFLMFLPIVLFIPNAFYYGFNEHATNSETTTINYKYQSNEVNSTNDLIQGNIYHAEYLNMGATNIYNNISYENDIQIEILSFYSCDINFNFDDYDEFIAEEYDARTYNNLSITYFVDNENPLCRIYFTNTNCFVSYETSDDLIFNNCVFRCTYGIQGLRYAIDDMFDIADFSYTDYNVIESVEINTNDTISNKMYQAWQSTWNLPLLQWTHTSFVAQPFTYITGLFGVPSDSTFNYLFAYFVSISICWLVFDLLMYVPNLAHRWLDKGALE